MRKNSGSTLLIVLLISMVALAIAISMMQLSTTKTVKAVNNKNSLQAYYAAEAGMNLALEALTSNISEVITSEPQEGDDPLYLPTHSNPADINGAVYYVDIEYPNDGTGDIIIKSTGEYKTARKNIKTRIYSDIDSAFKFGLLSKNQIDLGGNITFGLDIHGNGLDENGDPIRGGGLNFAGNSGNYDNLNGSIATQSNNSNPDPEDCKNIVEGSSKECYNIYREEQEVPNVDFDYFESQLFDAATPVSGQDLKDVTGIMDTTKNVYITSDYLAYNNNLDFCGPGLIQYSAHLPNKTINTHIALNMPDFIASNSIALISNSQFIKPLNSKEMKFKPFVNIINTAINNINLLTSPYTFNLSYINSNVAKHIIAGGKGNTDPTATPVPDEEPSETLNCPDHGNSQAGGSGSIRMYLPGGDHGGRIYYIDNGSETLNISMGNIVSNAIIVATGPITFNGSDRNDNGNPSGFLDTIIAAGGDILHNGSMDTSVFYWTDGGFRQNGSSDFVNARVMAQDEILINGAFSLTSTEDWADFEWLPRTFVVKFWEDTDEQAIPIADAGS